MSGSGDNRSVTAREVSGSSIVTGNHNNVATTMKQVAVPAGDQFDVKAELAALRDALAELKEVPDRGKLDRAIEDAVEETGKAKPDKAEVGGALERVGKYAKISLRWWFMAAVLQIGMISAAALPSDGQTAPNK
jgi:hypothetical protein